MKNVYADFYRDVSPPDSLSSMSTGTPSGKSENPDGTSNASSLPSGDTSRNIGRPSPDSPNLKTKNLDRSESYGRKPAEKPDFGYVHDSGSGSARVIPYDSGFANNSSALRNAGLIKPPQHLSEQVAEIGKGLVAQYWLRREQEDNNKNALNADDVEALDFILEELEYLPTGVKRGEHDEEEVIFQVENVQRAFSEMDEQLTRATLTFPNFYKLKAKIDRLDAQSIFNNPRGNKALIGSISDMTISIIRELKKWTAQTKQYIPNLVRDDYLEAVERLSKYRRRDGRRYFIEDDQYGIFSVSLQESSHGAAQYYWDGLHNITFNVIKTMTELPLKYLQDRETIANHELVHAMQQHYALQAKIEEAGLPGRRRDKQFRFDMMDKQKELRVQYAREGLDAELISIHALDDIEFYSRLLDEVTEFKRRRVHTNLNSEVRKWFKDRPFFASLKRYKPKNWKKAVGIFVDAVVSETTSKTAARPIRIDKAKIKGITKEAIKTIEGVVSSTKEETLSEALKRKTMNGKIFLDSYLVENGEHTTSVDIVLMVNKDGGGRYIYNSERGLHQVEVYLLDQKISTLKNPYLYKMQMKPALINQIFSVLIHEVTHAIDRIKYVQENLLDQGTSIDRSRIKTKEDKEKALADYYNHPREVKAHLQQVADEVEEYLTKKYGELSQESIRTGFKEAFGFYGSKTWAKLSRYLTPKNKKYVQKAVLTYLMEQDNG